MFYPPGQDPNKSPELNRQDEFFDSWRRADEKTVEMLRGMNNRLPQYSRRPERPRGYAPPLPGGPQKGRRLKKPAVPGIREFNWGAFVRLLVLAAAVDGLLIGGGASAPQVVGYTVLLILALVALFWLAGKVEDLLRSFLSSKVGKAVAMATVALAATWLVLWIT